FVPALDDSRGRHLGERVCAELRTPPAQIALGVLRVLRPARQDLPLVAVNEVRERMPLGLGRPEVAAFADGCLGGLRPALRVTETTETGCGERLALEADLDTIGSGAVVCATGFDGR